MKGQNLKLFLTFIFISIYISAFSQDNLKKALITDNIIDSLKKKGVILNSNQKKPEISLSTNEALIYLQQNLHPQMWRDFHDPLRQAIGRLVYEAAHPPFDSIRTRLVNFPYDSLNISWDKFYIWEPIKLRIPVLSKPEYNMGVDSVSITGNEGILNGTDSLKARTEVTKVTHYIRPAVELKDTTIMVIIDTLNEVSSTQPGSPFKYLNYPFQGDSIQAAVNSLIKYIDNRDSLVLSFTGLGKVVTPLVLNSKSEKVVRYWLKNEFSDSVAIWIENPSRNTIELYLEQGVNFRRPDRQAHYGHPKINVKSLDNKLLDFKNIAIKPKYWKYHSESSFILNQSAMSNWVKGGEGSLSTALDITGYADYNNKALKLSSNNFVRFNFGYIVTRKDGLTKNLDLLETNLKLNHLAFGKVYFSAVLLFKTQIAKGYNYFTTVSGKDTSNLVSKFMNPGILTVGLGFDYKPNKTTSINFSPLSYKGTFVIDPAYYNNRYDSTRIDQTQYGIPKNKTALNEPGASIMISNELKLNKTIDIINRLQLFTNYIHNPQNVDVDWEMIATTHLNWFTDVRLNTHLIFDDDTKTSEHNRPDGTEKKTARIQFKELVGLSLSFRF